MILVLEERNKYAVEICKRIRDKLDGLDPDPSNQSSISEQVFRQNIFPISYEPSVLFQVHYTIDEATDMDNLATLYEGWTSWV